MVKSRSSSRSQRINQKYFLKFSGNNLNKKVSKSIISSSSSDTSKKSDAGHYEYQIGETINEYKVFRLIQIIKHINDGTFGRVFEVQNTNSNQIYAMKVSKLK